MNPTKTNSKDSLKELYNESKKRVRMILNLLNRISKDNQFVFPDDHTLTTMSNLLLDIINSAELEVDTQYRNAILYIAKWINAALQNKFLEENQQIHPHPIFVVKKGVEILHSFLHRDLRRKQFSFEEHEIHQNYLALIRRLPSPHT